MIDWGEKEKKKHACAELHALCIHNGLRVCLSNVALYESETAQFKGLIMPAIRFRVAGTLSLSLSLTPHSQYPQAERGRERGRG